MGASLRPGDPAAIFDPTTGTIAWMAVNAQEKAQIGHYHLLKRDFARAWEWYEKAEQEMPPAADQALTLDGRLVDPRDFSFFHYHCLNQLGRVPEAQARLERFEKNFRQRLEHVRKVRLEAVSDEAEQRRLQDVLGDESLLTTLLLDLHCAEVFLSLDAGDDACTHFRAALARAGTDSARLSKALVLAQTLLLRERYAEYAELATDTLLPLLVKAWNPVPTGKLKDLSEAQGLLLVVGSWSLLPLDAPEFLARLPEAQVRNLLPRWQAVREQSQDPVVHLGVDLFLAAAHERLGQSQERDAVAARIRDNPARSELLPEDGVPGLIQKVRKLRGELGGMPG
jgi:hypothetical protein